MTCEPPDYDTNSEPIRAKLWALERKLLSGGRTDMGTEVRAAKLLEKLEAMGLPIVERCSRCRRRSLCSRRPATGKGLCLRCYGEVWGYADHLLI